jgi:hypothetical protein
MSMPRKWTQVYTRELVHCKSYILYRTWYLVPGTRYSEYNVLGLLILPVVLQNQSWYTRTVNCTSKNHDRQSFHRSLACKCSNDVRRSVPKPKHTLCTTRSTPCNLVHVLSFWCSRTPLALPCYLPVYPTPTIFIAALLYN